MQNAANGNEGLQAHRVVTREQWLVARKALLAEEKALTRAHDDLSRRRRELPWVKVEKAYVFDSSRGEQTLADLFEGRSQLIVDHFMLAPGWGEGCVGCSFGADHLEGATVHLENHDVAVVAVSRAPLAEIEAFKKRMGWRFRWVSSFGNDFNYDFQVSFTAQQKAANKVVYNYQEQEFMSAEMPGTSVFYKNAAGEIFHTYSTYARGSEVLLTTYACLDLTPKGRNESPGKNLTEWVRHHDRYEQGGRVDSTGRYVATEAEREPCCAHESERA